MLFPPCILHLPFAIASALQSVCLLVLAPHLGALLSIQITLDTYSHVAPGLQEAAAAQFDKLVSPRYNVTADKDEAIKNRY